METLWKPLSIRNIINDNGTSMQMANVLLKRIKRDIKDAVNSEELSSIGVKVFMDSDDCMKCFADIVGPPDTPFEDATYRLQVEFSNDFPFKPPKVTFKTMVWHPNISSQTGAICLNVLSENWKATTTLRTIILSVQSLLDDPQPTDPLDYPVAQMFLRDNDMYKRTAKYWAQYFGSGKGAFEDDFKSRIEMVLEVTSMTQKEALIALSNKYWNVEETVSEYFRNDCSV